MMAEMINEYDEFAPIKECGLTVELSWARAVEKKDGSKPPALMHHGQPALGLASKFKLQDRVHGKPDCRVTIDADWWDTAPEEQRRGLLFHELYHFEPKMDDTGLVAELDDAHRPKVNLKKHDYQVGWFYAAARRFGGASQECIQFKQLVDEGGQFMLPGVLGDKVEDLPAFGTPLHQLAASVLRQQLEREEAADYAAKHPAAAATVQGDPQRAAGGELAQESQAEAEQAHAEQATVTVSVNGGEPTNVTSIFPNTTKAVGARARRQAAGA